MNCHEWCQACGAYLREDERGICDPCADHFAQAGWGAEDQSDEAYEAWREEQLIGGGQ